MPIYELVGRYDCPFLAKAEKLLEEIQFQFPIVEFHKEMKDRVQWKDFVQKMKQTRGWEIKQSPVVWQILVPSAPNGKGHLIGGIDEFCEYVQAFFGIVLENDSTAALLEQVALNKVAFRRGFQGFDRGDKSVCNLAIVDGSTKMLEALLAQLLSRNSMIPPSLLLDIRLYSSDTLPQQQQQRRQRELEGLAMEAVDMASANLFKVSISATLSEAFYDSHFTLILTDFSKCLQEGDADWIGRVEQMALHTAEALNQGCAPGCKVLIGGDGPQCFVAEVFRRIVTPRKVKEGQLIALGQHVVNRAKGSVGRKGKVPPGCIEGVYAWGWPGLVGAYVEMEDAVARDTESSIQGPSPFDVPLGRLAENSDWIFNHFPDEYLVEQREQIHKTRAFTPLDLCLADAIGSTLRIWFKSAMEEATHAEALGEDEHGPPPTATANEAPGEAEAPGEGWPAPEWAGEAAATPTAPPAPQPEPEPEEAKEDEILEARRQVATHALQAIYFGHGACQPDTPGALLPFPDVKPYSNFSSMSLSGMEGMRADVMATGGQLEPLDIEEFREAEGEGAQEEEKKSQWTGAGEPFEEELLMLPEIRQNLEAPPPPLQLLSVGVECSNFPGAPDTIFMVQPSICISGSWIPAGGCVVGSEASHAKILQQVTKLWELRRQLVSTKNSNKDTNLQSQKEAEEFANENEE